MLEEAKKLKESFLRDYVHPRKILLEFNKGLNITSCQTWLMHYTGERTVGRTPLKGYNDRRYNPFSIKGPTLKQNGFKAVYDSVWGEVARWSNKDIVVYVMKKHNIDNKSQVLYDIKKESFSRNKSVQLFHKIP